MKLLKKIILGILVFFLSLIFIFNIYNLINLKILKKDLTSIGGYAVLEVVSGSMEPTIHVGDLIVIKTKDYKYKEQDIVTFYDTNGSFVTHRIMSLEKDQMITKGDHNNTEDEPSKTKSIVGKYVFKIGGLGNFLKALKNPLVSLMILIIGILICYLITMEKEQEEKLEKEEEYQEFLESKEENEEEKKTLLERIKEKFKRKKKKKGTRKKNKKKAKRKSQKKKRKAKKKRNRKKRR